MQSEKISTEDSSTAPAISGDETQDTVSKEFKGDGLMAEDLNGKVKDTDDFPICEDSKIGAMCLFSLNFYISKVLMVVSVLIVFLGVLGCFRLR